LVEGVDHLTVAINGSLMHPQPTGLSRYGVELCSCLLRLLPKAKIYTKLKELEDLFPEQVVSSGPKFKHPANLTSNLKRLLWLQTGMRLNLYFKKPKLNFAPIAEGIIYSPVPQIVTIHDLLPLYDPDFMPRWKIYYSKILPKILKNHCRKIICVSEFTRVELLKYYPEINQNLIKVIHPGFNPLRFQTDGEFSVFEKFGFRDYFLMVGEGRPYKNLELVPKALSIYRGNSILAICGRVPEDEKTRIQGIANEVGVGARMRWLGYVSDEDLGLLYKNSKAFIFPSRYEGFGLPLLEAMSFGAPILSSNAASLPEVGGSVPIYFDPFDPMDLSQKMKLLDEDQTLVERMRTAGYKRVKHFTWEESAHRHIDLFIDVLN